MNNNNHGSLELKADMERIRQLAENGYAEAQYLLGSACYEGKFVTVDNAETLKRYRSAAEQGHKGAQYNLETIQKSKIEAPIIDTRLLEFIPYFENINPKTICEWVRSTDDADKVYGGFNADKKLKGTAMRYLVAERLVYIPKPNDTTINGKADKAVTAQKEQRREQGV